MNILVITGIYPPDAGGPASFVPRLTNALTRRGVRTAVITFSDVIVHPSDDAAHEITRIGRRHSHFVRLIKLVAALIRLGRVADVWLVQGLIFATSLVGWVLRKRQIYKVVGDLAWERAVSWGWYGGSLDEFQEYSGGLRIRWLKFLRFFPLLMADNVIVPSQYLARIVSGWGVPKTKIMVIYNAVDHVPEFIERRTKAAGTPFEIVTVGRLVKWKNVDGILRALSSLPQCALTVIGDGAEYVKLVQLAEELEISNRVHWKGRLDADAVNGCLCNADAFVLNSTYEGLPHTVLEAFAAMLPVIATRVGGTPEIVQDRTTGILVAPNDPIALAEAIETLRGDRDLARRLAVGGHELFLKGFSTATMIHAYENVLCAS